MLTENRDLRGGLPIWLDRGTRGLSGERLGKTEHVDAVIVGSGISGALMADALKQSGLDVLVVDRRKPMSGSTPASTCLLQSELDTPLSHLSRKIGAQAAARAWTRSAEAVQALSNRIMDLGLDCDFRERQSLYLPGNLLDDAGLAREFAQRRKIGLRAQLLSRAEMRDMKGPRASAAILTQGNAEADPYQLLAGIWRSFRKRGGRLADDCEVAHIDESKSRVNVSSASGCRIIARHVVFCTGYELLEAFKPKGFKIKSTWALATRPQASKLWAGRRLIWEAADPYLYMRTTLDGRVIVGGEDEDFSDEEKRDRLIAKKTKAIIEAAKRYFPEIDFTSDYAWAGNFGESPTSLPLIGLLPHHRRSYSVMGFGGNGITFSMLAAQIVSRAIQGISDPDAEIFDT
jgi:glycine/D-amino acid oxidase-like deaminating enzyme